MVTRPRRDPESKTSRDRPATTPNGRENQLVAKAVNLAEQQLEDGTASAQVITHYLKLGSSRERLEQERIRHENELLVVKKEALEATKKSDELFKEAMDYFRAYTGNGPIQTEYDQDA